MKRVPLSGFVGALLVLLGGTVMIGWAMQLSPLVRVLPGFTPMVFNTALCFVLAGGALLVPFSDADRYRRVTTVLGVGLLFLAVGLWSAWKRFRWGRVRLLTREDDRIAFLGATILVAIALAAGIVTFAIIQGRVQTLVENNVLAALTRRTETLLDLIELREVNARIAATRPAVLRNLRVIRARRGDGANIADVRAVVESLVKEGLSGSAYYH